MTASQVKFTDFINARERAASTPIIVERFQAQAVVAKGVEMVYHTGSQVYQVLSGVDLTIERGDIQLLMGPSGSGKTTLLSILAGILTPTAGSVQLLGQEITQMSRSDLAHFRLQNIGFIFQGFNLFPALTASENVEVALKVKGVRGSAKRRQMAQALLKASGDRSCPGWRSPNYYG
jgi:putative ABC transport system ATP-binding protein